MGNVKIRNLTAAGGPEIVSGNMVAIALDQGAGLAKETRKATFSQIVSGGSGILAEDPNTPFIFNNGKIINSETGAFSKSLTISGVSVATGSAEAQSQWSEGATAGDIYYNNGRVAVGGSPISSLGFSVVDTINPSAYKGIYIRALGPRIQFSSRGSNPIDSHLKFQSDNFPANGGEMSYQHTGTPGSFISFKVDGNTEPTLNITNVGVGVGKKKVDATFPSEVLDVSGNGRFRLIGNTAVSSNLSVDTDGVLTTNASDISLKTNIKPIESALDKALGLSGVYYNWKKDPGALPRIGFIAQDAAKAAPELVFENDGTKGVHYDMVPAILVEAIRELKAENDELKSRLDSAGL